MGDLSGQIDALGDEFLAEMVGLIRSGEYVGGQFVDEFESAFANYLNQDFAIGVANGTDALEVIFTALGLPAGSLVLVPANTFIATAEAVKNTGYSPFFYDVTEDFGMDLFGIPEDVLIKSEVLVVVHLYGHPQDMNLAREVASKYNLMIVEDCAQAHGATFQGQKVGTFGKASAFSFYPGKNLGAAGDAGAIVTGDPELAARVKRIRNHGRLAKFDHELLGRNSRLDNIQALVLLRKLNHLDKWNNQRNANALRYRANLSQHKDLLLPPEVEGSVYHHFSVRTSSRDELRSYLKGKGCESGLHYPLNLASLRFFGRDARTPLCPVSQRISETQLSLPVGEHLGTDEVDAVSVMVNDFLQSRKP